jgi:invasion protein IalB
MAAVLTCVLTILVLGSAAVAQKKSSWTVVCTNAKDAKTCRMVQKLYTKHGEKGALGKVVGLTVIYGGTPRRPVLVMDLPLGVDLRRGMVLRVDKGKEMTAPYLRCTGNGCTSRKLLTPKLLATLRRGNKLEVGFLPFASQETLVVPASLTGFTKAFARIR